MLNNYIAKKIPFTKIGNKFMIENEYYVVDFENCDPEYWSDSILDIAYYRLHKEDNKEETTIYILAFERISKGNEEWSHDFDVDNCYVLAIY